MFHLILKTKTLIFFNGFGIALTPLTYHHDASGSVFGFQLVYRFVHPGNYFIFIIKFHTIRIRVSHQHLIQFWKQNRRSSCASANIVWFYRMFSVNDKLRSSRSDVLAMRLFGIDWYIPWIINCVKQFFGLAVTSVRTSQKLFMSTMRNMFYWISISHTHFIYFWKQNQWCQLENTLCPCFCFYILLYTLVFFLAKFRLGHSVNYLLTLSI